jgi:hypothetical protein
MMIDKEMLMQRRATLEADMAAISGALQQIDWTLDRLESAAEQDEVGAETKEDNDGLA